MVRRFTPLYSTLITVLGFSTASAEGTEPLALLERSALGHHFYSERVFSSPGQVDYVVCNKTDGRSDFFWPFAAFGVAPDPGLPAHHCVMKSDFLRRVVEVDNDFGNVSAKVEVRDEKTQIPTVIWCEYGFGDRCAKDHLGYFLSWSSSLREFAEGADGNAIPPLISIETVIEGGRYQIDIERTDGGDLLIVANTPPSEGQTIEIQPEVEAKFGTVGDFIKLGNTSITRGLTQEMRAILTFSNTRVGQRTRLYLDNVSNEPVSFAIIGLVNGTAAYRLDSVPLVSLLQ